MKITFLILSFVLFTSIGKCQQNPVFDQINNDTIDWHVFHIAPTFWDGRCWGPFYVIRIEKSPAMQTLINQMSAEEWIHALENPKTDWAANLLLYELFRKDALVYIHAEKERWPIITKEVEVQFWRQKLNCEN